MATIKSCVTAAHSLPVRNAAPPPRLLWGLGAALAIAALVLSPALAQASSGPCPPPDPDAIRPVPIAPEGIITNPRPTLSWHPVPGYDEYVFKLLYADTGEYVDPPGYLTSVEDGTSWTPDRDLPIGREMRWAVKVYCHRPDGGFASGYYSREMYFKIVSAPPVLVSPVGCTPTTRPTFRWSASAGATAYWLIVGDSPDFSNPSTNWLINTTVAGTSYPSPIDFNPGQTLYWKVKSLFGDRPGSWATTRDFTPSPWGCQ